jgi:hypothetical protein
LSKSRKPSSRKPDGLIYDMLFRPGGIWELTHVQSAVLTLSGFLHDQDPLLISQKAHNEP